MRESISANGTEKQTNWDAIDWGKANRVVRNLRQRIFRAAREGDQKKGTLTPKTHDEKLLEPARECPTSGIDQRWKIHAWRG